jgi:hypothetical protein
LDETVQLCGSTVKCINVNKYILMTVWIEWLAGKFWF